MKFLKALVYVAIHGKYASQRALTSYSSELGQRGREALLKGRNR